MANLNDINGDNVPMDFELSDEDDEDDVTLSSDSDYGSDQSEDLEDRVRITLDSSQIRALNGRTRHCMMSIYYSTLNGDIAICASCMINLNDTGVSMHLVRKHEINVYDALCDRSCTNCRLSLFMIIPCQICPICVA
ncbi:hypothetical protein PUN28_002111 [Cardiocondyla obscurior]|uniref:Zinc finger protein n=1 Tax=Cardiocondyla obscurior TaxID=286306 RepID=A0AAW2GSK4_9HYME